MGLVFSVTRKNIISAFRGEYLDFVISRVCFALFNIASGWIIYSIFKGGLNDNFTRYTGMQDYLGFLIIGTAMYSFTLSIFLNVSRTLMTERREGTLEAVLLAPFFRLKYYFGSLLAQMILVSIDFSALLLVSLLLGVRLKLNLYLLCMGLTLLFLTLLGISVLVSLAMISLRDTFFIQNTLLPLFLLTGGYLFPPNYLPVPLQFIANCLPLNFSVNLIRNGLLISSASQINMVQYLGYLCEALIFTIIGISQLGTIEKAAIEKMLS